MLYAGYVNGKVVERLPSLLEKAKINPDRKIQYDFGSFSEPDNPFTFKELETLSLNRNIFIIVPINQFFGRNQLSQSIRMIKDNYTMIFTNIENDEPLKFVVFHQGEVFSQQYTHEDTLFHRLSMSQLPPVNPWYEALVEVIGNRQTAYQYLLMLNGGRKGEEVVKPNTKFRQDIERLFDTIDARVYGRDQLLQKLVYVLQFTKYGDSSQLKETFGDDAMYKAETVIGQWKKSFNLLMDEKDIAVIYEAELLDIDIIDRLNVENN